MANKEPSESLTGIDSTCKSQNELSMQWKIILAGFRTLCQRLRGSTMI
jgi:hypothetical protein